MADNKQSFILYHDVRKPLELLTDEQRGRLFMAILDYSEHGTVQDFHDGALNMAFAFIKTALDRDAASWESKREKRREAGSMGGKQAQANRANATFANQNEQTRANQAVPVPVPAPVPVPKESGADKPPARPRFTPPTLEEVTAYVQERGSKVDPQGFIDFYAAKGWKIGTSPMKDWKAACRNAEKWERWDKAPAADRNRLRSDSDYQSDDDFFGGA